MFGLIGQKFDYAGSEYTVTEFIKKFKFEIWYESIGYSYHFKVECDNLSGTAAYFPRDRLLVFKGRFYVFDEIPMML